MPYWGSFNKLVSSLCLRVWVKDKTTEKRTQTLKSVFRMRENEVNVDKDKACNVNHLTKPNVHISPSVNCNIYIYCGNDISSTLLDCKAGTVR